MKSTRKSGFRPPLPHVHVSLKQSLLISRSLYILLPVADLGAPGPLTKAFKKVKEYFYKKFIEYIHVCIICLCMIHAYMYIHVHTYMHA